MILFKFIKKIKFILPLLLLTVVLYSCSHEDNLEDYETKSELINDVNIESDDSNDANRVSCDLNLTNNGCEFTSGEGKIAASYNTMISLLDNCHTETLPSNCSWSGNYYQEKTMYQVFPITHCKDFTIMNLLLDGYEDWAKSIRPDSSYIIVGYELQTANNTFDGYFRLKIRVIYRKKICSLSGNPSNFKPAG